MNSPLKYDEEIVKEFKIDKSIELEPVVKLAYTRSQLEEISKAAYRVRVDLLVAQYQVDNAEDTNMATQHQAKVNEQRVLLKQFVNSIIVLKKLVGELERSIDDSSPQAN